MELVRVIFGVSLFTKILITAYFVAVIGLYFLFHPTNRKVSPRRAVWIVIIYGVVVGFALGLSEFDPNDSLLTALPPITLAFIGFILTIWGYFFFFRFTPTTVSNVPSLLTSLGIFGTFVGIAWGLFGFDANDIEGSIPTLLDGVKSAFWSSVAGLGGAVMIKFRHVVAISFGEKKGADVGGATIDDVARLLGEGNRSLAGDAETTIVSQLLLARQDLNERLDHLKRSFDEFTKQLDRTNSQALIETPQDIARNFNTNINEPIDEISEELNQVAGKR